MSANGICWIFHQMLDICAAQRGSKVIVMFHILAVTSVLLAFCFGSELHPANRILGGNETDATTIPYQVSLELSNNYRCSGAIVSPSWVVTVASCLIETDSANLVVRAGPVLRGIMGTLRNVSFYVTYPYYDDEIMDYDIALVKLSEDIPFDSTIDSVDIGKEVPFDGNDARVSGWGATSSGAWLSSVINQKNVTIVYFNDCKYLYDGIQNPVTERMFCAGSRDGGPCQGDPGDPLVYNEQLIGLMSWSFGCGDGKYPAVYTDVTKFRGWIADYAGLSI